jgi:hypothetical protein
VKPILPENTCADTLVLATLVVASADEDKYGFVQAVLPATLEALVRVRVAALALGAELAPIASKVAPEAADDVRAQTAGVADTIAVGVYRIVDRFGRSLQAFRFPTHVAAQLTEMCKA